MESQLTHCIQTRLTLEPRSTLLLSNTDRTSQATITNAIQRQHPFLVSKADPFPVLHSNQEIMPTKEKKKSRTDEISLDDDIAALIMPRFSFRAVKEKVRDESHDGGTGGFP